MPSFIGCCIIVLVVALVLLSSVKGFSLFKDEQTDQSSPMLRRLGKDEKKKDDDGKHGTTLVGDTKKGKGKPPPPGALLPAASSQCLVAVTGPGLPIDLTFDGTLSVGTCYENIYTNTFPVGSLLPGPNKCCDPNNPLFLRDSNGHCCLTTDSTGGICHVSPPYLNFGKDPCVANFPNPLSGPWSALDSSLFAQSNVWCKPPQSATYASPGPPFVFPKFPKNQYTGVTPTTAVVVTQPDTGYGVESSNSLTHTINLDVGVYQLAFDYAIPSFGVNYTDFNHIFLDILVFGAQSGLVPGVAATITVGSQPFLVPSKSYYLLPFLSFHTQPASVDWVPAKSSFFEVTTAGAVVFETSLDDYGPVISTTTQKNTAAVGLVNFTILKVSDPSTTCIASN